MVPRMPPRIHPARVWAAVLGAEISSDEGCWAPFYDQLLASPTEPETEACRKQAMQILPSHEPVRHADGRRTRE